MKNILDINNRTDFRNWLINNSSREEECFIKVKKGKPIHQDVFYYIDAVEEAICFGWIDSVNLVIEGERYQRFSPRVKRSPWSELNKERVRRLIKLGLMSKEGKKSLPKDIKKKYRLDPEFIELLKKNRCYSKFKKFPELYQRIRAYNILFYKKTDIKLYESSLNNLIKYTKEGKMFGEWNDYGRLLNY